MAVLLTPDPVRRARSALANAHRRDGDPARITEARRALTAAKLERAIHDALAATPPITTECRTALSELLVSGESV